MTHHNDDDRRNDSGLLLQRWIPDWNYLNFHKDKNMREKQRETCRYDSKETVLTQINTDLSEWTFPHYAVIAKREPFVIRQIKSKLISGR